MKRGPFPMWPAFPTSEYYDPLRLPLDRPHHFPGSPVIGGHRFPPPTVAGPRRLSRVPRTTIRTFNAQYAGGFLSARFWIPGAFHGLRRHLTGSAPPLPAHRRSLDDAYSGFTHVADRTVAHAPLRTRPLDHARGHHYRGPRRLPGPDSHRQATLNLSLLYVMWFSFSSWRRSSLGAPRESDSQLPRIRARRDGLDRGGTDADLSRGSPHVTAWRGKSASCAGISSVPVPCLWGALRPGGLHAFAARR
jgi:hypothetical protein